jgi:transposase
MALSDDLRKRVIEAMAREGMSRNAATRRLGVSIAAQAVAALWSHGRDFTGSDGGDRRDGAG